MSTVLNDPRQFKPTAQAFLVEWWPVLVGLLALFVPTYVGLANGIWNSE